MAVCFGGACLENVTVLSSFYAAQIDAVANGGSLPKIPFETHGELHVHETDKL